jgi:hypothetical protein
VPVAYSSERRRACGFVTFTPSALQLHEDKCQGAAGQLRNGAHRARISMRLRELTLCAISAAKLLLCMRRRSTSRTLYTRNFLRPLGRRWRVYVMFERAPAVQKPRRQTFLLLP